MTYQYFPSRTDGPSFRNCARAIWVVAGIANNYMTACGYSVQVAAFKFQTSKSERNRHACAYNYGSQGKLHLDEEQAVQTAAGIRVNGATNCIVRENYVAGPGPDNLFFVGLILDWIDVRSLFATHRIARTFLRTFIPFGILLASGSLYSLLAGASWYSVMFVVRWSVLSLTTALAIPLFTSMLKRESSDFHNWQRTQTMLSE